MNKRKIINFLVLLTAFLIMGSMTVFAAETAEPVEYVTADLVNFRASASTEAEVICKINSGVTVQVESFESEGWSVVIYNDVRGYIKSEFLLTPEAYAQLPTSNIELLEWHEAQNVFTRGVDALVYDVRTGLTYYVRSFSNGNHADVETVTQQDTDTMLRTYGGSWSWDPRPVFVTINGRTMVASINGMPHGGGVISGNGMAGQVCIHFKDSTTHNGNKAFERDHQAAVMEAWAAR